MRPAPLLFGLSLLCTFACSNSSSSTTTIVRPELVAVDPQDFLGALRCGEGQGEVHSYVATLLDVTEPSDGGPPSCFALASSPPTPCGQPVTFSQVITNHRYIAEVDGYDTTDIAPIAPGSRLQSDGNGLRVKNLWSSKCGGYLPSPDAGEPDAGRYQYELPGVFAYDALTQTPHNCLPKFGETADADIRDACTPQP